MRLTGLSVSGFRGFPNPQSFDLDADAVVIVGVNGQGKTSLFDAVLWGLTGVVPRVGDDTRLVSMYSPSGESRVEVELRTLAGDVLTVARSFDGEKQQLRVVQVGSTSQGDAAGVNLTAALWPEASHTSDGPAALLAALTRSVYLQQDLVRQFIEADDEQERFRAVSELVGAGRVTELSLSLERAKVAWSRSSNVQTKDLDAARSRLASLEARLGGLAQPSRDDDGVLAEWAEWWERTREITEQREPVPSFESSEAPRILDSAVKTIDTQRRAAERRAVELTDLSVELEEDPEEAGTGAPLDDLRERANQSERRLVAAREALIGGQAQAAELRRVQVQNREAQAEVRALADIALRHLDGACPVCGQGHDLARTRGRLEAILTSTNTGREGDAQIHAPNVASLASEVEHRERENGDAKAAVRAAESRARGRALLREERGRRIVELGVDAGDGRAQAIAEAIAEALGATKALLAHRNAGEELALQVARAGEIARRSELQGQIESLRAEAAALEKTARNRERTGDLAGAILDGLRNAASEVVATRLDEIDPLLQRIYATADPHPSFRAVRLLTKIARGRGRLNATVLDPKAELSSDAPSAVLSSSQLNALAVSVFLALNLGVPSLPMRAVMLDDPLQSLDDVNLLGLIDLLRRTKDQRQLLVSTHDLRFGRLLTRKLRPVGEGQRTRVIALDAWGPHGPTVHQEDVARDGDRLRIAA